MEMSTQIQKSDNPTSIGLLTPLAPAKEVRENFKFFRQYKNDLLDEEDKQIFKVKVKQPDGSWKAEEKEFAKKQGCDKLSFAFTVSTEVVKQEIKEMSNQVIASVWVKATLPSGYYRTKDASCSSLEKMKDVWFDGKPTGEKEFINPNRLLHDIISHAETRASNRAILTVLGSGEISAEEMSDASSGHGGVDTPSESQAEMILCSCDSSNIKPNQFATKCLTCNGQINEYTRKKYGLTEDKSKQEKISA
jgi:hypothetical protein